MISVKESAIETEILNEPELQSLSAEKKERYYSKIIREILSNSEDGITRSEIQELTGFSLDAISRHLDKLVAMNFAYVKKFGRTKVYFPNSKTLHSSGKFTFSVGEKKYILHEIDNPSRSNVYIQERKEDEFGAENISGGILVSKDDFSNFISNLEVFKEEKLNGN